MKARVLAALIALAACTPDAPLPEDQDAALSDYYMQVETQIRANGGMRREYWPRDARFNTNDLIENFKRIAFYSEMDERAGRFVQREKQVGLQRWQDPVRIGVHHSIGASVGQVNRDRKAVAVMARRLRNITGHDISLVDDPEDANMRVTFFDTESGRLAADRIEEADTPLSKATLNQFRNPDPSILCMGSFAGTVQSPSSIAFALIIINDAQTPALRESCIHEELAQALGLLNDSFLARPSIFNDDEEFALITAHDAALLRMLYDERLRPGMSLEEATPMLPQLAADALAFVQQGGP
ncbi:DUF2927 domain-containing protein [Paracoccaceae bacterium GXU_MW_L88]